MEQLPQCLFIDLCADHAETAGIIGAAVTEFIFAGHIVELEPLTIVVLQDTLGTENTAVLFFVGKLIKH